MKRYICICLISIIAVSCNDNKEIPLEVFGKIVQETLLTAATVNNVSVLKDSVKNMDYYGPILTKYGYTVADMEYTVETMVSRKSKILSATLEKARADIETNKIKAEYFYDISNNFNILVKQNYIDTIYKFYPKYKLNNNKKIDNNLIYFPLVGAGEYRMRMYYTSYSLPKNISYYANTRLLDSMNNMFSHREQGNKYVYNKPAKKIIKNKNKMLNIDVNDDKKEDKKEDKDSVIQSNTFNDGTTIAIKDAKNEVKKKKTEKELREEARKLREEKKRIREEKKRIREENKYSGVITVTWMLPDIDGGNVIELNAFSITRGYFENIGLYRKRLPSSNKYIMPDLVVDSIVLTRIPYSEDVFYEVLKRNDNILMPRDYYPKADIIRMPYVDMNLDFVDTLPRYIQDTSGYDMMFYRHFIDLIKKRVKK